MAKEFQPHGATWAQLKNKSGMARTTFKRGFNLAKEKKWFVGGGEQNKPFFLNADGSWREALLGPDGSDTDAVGLAEPSSDIEIGTDEPSGPSPEAESHLALMSEAIAHVDQKRRS
jgi:hypothetical protein